MRIYATKYLCILFVSAFLLVSYENSNTTNKGILDVQSGSTDETVGENYNNKAPFKIIFVVCDKKI